MNTKYFVVCDNNVFEFAKLKFGEYPILQIIADEQHKTFETVIDICRWLLEMGADRQSLIYAVGGGVTTDLVGFAASIYKRGIPYINVPTTLLSQVDAALGGKTGCNLDSYKNMIGLIVQPKDTIIYPEVLKTLPRKQILSGAAEMLKSFIIKDGGNYQKAVDLLSRKEIDFEELAPLVIAAGEVKKEIVALDPYEKNLRRVLNLGHTFGHAIEWRQSLDTGLPRPEGLAMTETNSHGETVTDPSLEPTYSSKEPSYSSLKPSFSSLRTNVKQSHGEAVAIGIIEAARISYRRGLCTKSLVDKLITDFNSCGLPTELPYSRKELLQAIKQDKKVENTKINFVLIKDIGKVVIEKIDDLYLY